MAGKRKTGAPASPIRYKGYGREVLAEPTMGYCTIVCVLPLPPPTPSTENCWAKCGLACASYCDRFDLLVCEGCPCRRAKEKSG